MNTFSSVCRRSAAMLTVFNFVYAVFMEHETVLDMLKLISGMLVTILLAVLSLAWREKE